MEKNNRGKLGIPEIGKRDDQNPRLCNQWKIESSIENALKIIFITSNLLTLAMSFLRWIPFI